MSFEPTGTGGGGGGGGAVTVADGADVTQGAIADVAWSGSGNGTVNAILKAIYAKVAGTLAATITGALPAGGNTIGGVNVVSSSVHTSYTTDSLGVYAPADQILYNGTLYPVLFAKIDVATSGDQAIVAAATSPSRKIIVLQCVMVAAGTVAVKWRSGSTDLQGAMSLIANVGYQAANPPYGVVATAAGSALNLNLGSSIQVSGSIAYIAAV